MSGSNFSWEELDRLFEEEGLYNKGGKPIDLMHEETNREIERTKKRLAKEYKQAEKELQKKTDDYFKRFAKADKEKARLVKQGALSQAEYIEWRKNKILYGENMKHMVESMSQHMVNVDKQAANVVNHRLAGVYANNYNYATYGIEKGLKINTGFALHSEKSVERLANKYPRLLPKSKVNIPKDKAWQKRHIVNAITQGILQGESLDKVAHRLEKVCEMGWSNAYRNARTAMTGAQNAGRLDCYKDAERMGIKLKKQWMATLDDHTRESHAELDGQSVETDKPFSNGLMYPGDPDGEPGEVYNCRCTMVTELEDYPDDKFERYDNINGEPIDNVTYSEWAAAKETAGEAEETVFDKIKNIRDDASLTEVEKIEKAGKLFAEDVDNNYISAYRSEREALLKEEKLLREEMRHATDIDAMERKRDAFQDKVDAFEKKYSQETHSKALAERLGKVRSIGYKEDDINHHLNLSKSPVKKHVMHAYQHYPSDWIEKSIKTGSLTPKKVNRGYYAHMRREIAISGYNAESMRETAFHELGHRFERVVPGILKQEKAFYARRTSGESLQWLGRPYARSEVSRKDKFLNAYMGKDYGGSAYELVSMGFEMAYTDPIRLADDPDMAQWIYGMLCVL